VIVLALLDKIGTLKAPSRSATTSQFSVSYATETSDVRVRLAPMRGRSMLTALGGIPSGEFFEAFIDGNITAAPGYELVVNSVTYVVKSVETYGDDISPTFHRCLVQRHGSQ